MRKSERALNDAELLFGGDSLVGCVNRLYYAVFYAVSAVLAQEGREYGKHTAVRAALHRDFVKPGRVPRQCSITYNTLFDDRQEGDYTPRTSFDKEEIEKLVGEARSFVKQFAALIEDTKEQSQ
jgi:hypothetical protein